MQTLAELTAPKTFDRIVAIPMFGGTETREAVFTFRHRTWSEFRAFVEAVDKPTDDELAVVADVVEGWKLEEPFSRDALAQLLNDVPGAGPAILRTYVAEYVRVRAGVAA